MKRGNKRKAILMRMYGIIMDIYWVFQEKYRLDKITA